MEDSVYSQQVLLLGVDATAWKAWVVRRTPCGCTASRRIIGTLPSTAYGVAICPTPLPLQQPPLLSTARKPPVASKSPAHTLGLWGSAAANPAVNALGTQ